MLEYFRSFWNLVNLFSIVLNIALIASDIVNIDENILKNIASAAVLLMWLQLFYFFRLFEATAHLVRMI
jgi:hypothetical protein